MNVVADSSPLVILAKLGCFDLLFRFYSGVYISPQVHNEVVIAGAGLPGAAEVANAAWIKVKQLQNQAEMIAAQDRYPLGLGKSARFCWQKRFRPMKSCSMIATPANWRELRVSMCEAAWAFSKRSIYKVR